MKAPSFEKSVRDIEPAGMREGSKKEEAFDSKQIQGQPARKPEPPIFTEPGKKGK